MLVKYSTEAMTEAKNVDWRYMSFFNILCKSEEITHYNKTVS